MKNANTPLGRLERSLSLNPTQKWLLIAGFLLLVAIAFFDNMRGPLLPVIAERLKLPYSDAGMFLAIGNFAAIPSMLLLGWSLKRFSDKAVGLFACFLAFLPGVIAPFVNDKSSLLILGVLMGSCVAIVGALSSIFGIKGAPLALRGKLLSAQQVMYGLGSFLAPICVAITLPFSWWAVTWISSTLFALIAFFVIRNFQREIDENSSNEATQRSDAKEVRGLAPLVVIAFGFYVGGEVLSSMWMSTYMVSQFGMSPSKSANYVGGFFLCLTIARFLSFLFIKAHWEKKAIIISLLLGILALFAARLGYAWAFILVGLLGPFYPLMMAQISRQFDETWQKLTIWVFISIQTTLGLIHLSVGRITDALGIRHAFLIAPSLLALCLLLLLVFFAKVRARSMP